MAPWFDDGADEKGALCKMMAGYKCCPLTVGESICGYGRGERGSCGCELRNSVLRSIDLSHLSQRPLRHAGMRMNLYDW